MMFFVLLWLFVSPAVSDLSLFGDDFDVSLKKIFSSLNKYEITFSQYLCNFLKNFLFFVFVLRKIEIFFLSEQYLGKNLQLSFKK